MTQAPPQGAHPAPAAQAGPNGVDPMLQAYWNARHDLLQSISNGEIRRRVQTLIDGRVVQQATQSIPPAVLQGVPLTFSTLQQTQAVFHSINSFSPVWTGTFLQKAVPYVGVVHYRYTQNPKGKALLESWDAKDSVVTGVLAAAGPWLAIQGLAVVGFTTSGIAAGSLAALWQSSIGNVVAGSLFSMFQSFGALGALTGPWGIAAGAAGAGVYGVYRWASMPTAEEIFNTKLDVLLNDAAERDQFWASINV